jgi:RNA polymerase sigma-70 factor (ECF subfamily)
VASGGPAPDAALLEKELGERLRLAVAHLPQREGAVFCMRYFEDLSYQQIAEALRIRPGAVATALHKARAKLEEYLLEPFRETNHGPQVPQPG